MPLKLSELESWLLDLRTIIIDLNISINNAKYLLSEHEQLEQRMKKHGFFQHHIYQLRFISIIQLCKVLVYSRNEKRNVHKLLNRLQNEKYDLELSQKIDSIKEGPLSVVGRSAFNERIDHLRLEIEKYETMIDNLKMARDKVYAHKDPNQVVPFIKWPDIEALVSLCVNIYNQIYGGLDGSTMRFDWTFDWNVEHIIKGLAYNNDRHNKNKT